MKNNYYEVSITFNKNNYDELYNKLYTEGVENILEEEGVLKIYFEAGDLKKINMIKQNLIEDEIIKAKDLTIEKFENKNWNEEWEKSIEPVYIKDKIIIYPSWKKDELKNHEGKILIEIDPKMSFGTGHNETTQLVLELMCDYIKGAEERMLDFGTGTGVLSIAGIKMGIDEAIAIDTDADSIANAKEYFRKNDVHKKIKLQRSGIKDLEEFSFDVIAANIIRSVITENFEHINDRLKVNGKLFLSGILNTEDQEILELLFQNDFDVEDIVNKSEWIGIYAIKR